MQRRRILRKKEGAGKQDREMKKNVLENMKDLRHQGSTLSKYSIYPLNLGSLLGICIYLHSTHTFSRCSQLLFFLKAKILSRNIIREVSEKMIENFKNLFKKNKNREYHFFFLYKKVRFNILTYQNSSYVSYMLTMKVPNCPCEELNIEIPSKYSNVKTINTTSSFPRVSSSIL